MAEGAASGVEASSDGTPGEAVDTPDAGGNKGTDSDSGAAAAGARGSSPTSSGADMGGKRDKYGLEYGEEYDLWDLPVPQVGGRSQGRRRGGADKRRSSKGNNRREGKRRGGGGLRLGVARVPLPLIPVRLPIPVPRFKSWESAEVAAAAAAAADAAPSTASGGDEADGDVGRDEGGNGSRDRDVQRSGERSGSDAVDGDRRGDAVLYDPYIDSLSSRAARLEDIQRAR